MTGRRNSPGRNARRRAWDAARRLGEFTLPQLMVEAKIAEDNARAFIAQFEDAGHVTRLGKTEEVLRSLIVWRLVKDPGAAWLQAEDSRRAPRSRAWLSMRIFRTFRLTDIISTAEIGEDNAYKFLRALEDVGYVQQAQARDSGRRGGNALYRLVRDTGPEAPIPLRDGSVYDPNKREAVGRHCQSMTGDRAGRRARAWGFIRDRKTFTVADICQAARMSEDGTRRYLWALARAGFIHGAQVKTCGAPGHKTEYRLVVDPGPEAPTLMPDGMVYNPNDGRMWGQAQ